MNRYAGTMESYSPLVDKIIRTAPEPALGPGTLNAAGMEAVESVAAEDLFPGGHIQDHDYAFCCLAACFLLQDELDRAHQLAQQVETPSGSFWHGIMHRREGDFSNAKYWFRQAGAHPVFDALKYEFGDDYGSPYSFVDRVEAAQAHNFEDKVSCLEIQKREWTLLFDHCWEGAQ